MTAIAIENTVASPVAAPRPGSARRWTGRVLTTLVTLFLLFDVTLKFLRPPMVVEGTLKLGYPESSILVLGIVLLACTVLYLVPRTAVLGAVLLTGYLGGAVATHLRVGDPLLSHTVFPVYVGALIWAGLVLRRPSLAPLLGLSSVPTRR
jgi:DoxX-like family